MKLFKLTLMVICASLSCLMLSMKAGAHSISEILPKIKPSVVGIGVYNPLNSPRARLEGTGFVVGDGTYIITNEHVIEKDLDPNLREKRVVFVGTGLDPEVLDAKVVDIDVLHDLAILKINKKLPALKLDQREFIDEGVEVAFTGFPIGSILGLYPATHRGIISARTPVITPMHSANTLTPALIKRLKTPYFIYQMDATAYPGNSGSAVYDVETGKVVGVINKVFVKETKETVLEKPSGITYSIPVKYVIELMKRAGVSQAE